MWNRMRFLEVFLALKKLANEDKNFEIFPIKNMCFGIPQFMDDPLRKISQYINAAIMMIPCVRLCTGNACSSEVTPEQTSLNQGLVVGRWILFGLSGLFTFLVTSFLSQCRNIHTIFFGSCLKIISRRTVWNSCQFYFYILGATFSSNTLIELDLVRYKFQKFRFCIDHFFQKNS